MDTESREKNRAFQKLKLCEFQSKFGMKMNKLWKLQRKNRTRKIEGRMHDMGKMK